VRRRVVEKALAWLTRNNPLYAKIDIDTAELDSWDAPSHGVPRQIYARLERAVSVGEGANGAGRATYGTQFYVLGWPVEALHPLSDCSEGSGWWAGVPYDPD